MMFGLLQRHFYFLLFYVDNFGILFPPLPAEETLITFEINWIYEDNSNLTLDVRRIADLPMSDGFL
jgi:hypothetical protein